ncbi:transposase family protein [Nocardia sp. CNY236]|uniref:transposase family protein n=1 Tax=Nocardia sp. CNY236 TaxID=1169152 RepID=UPI00048F202D|nr:transposase family protein [Nocardia sp. CNY236]
MLMFLADPRKLHGVRHPVAAITAVALAATLTGARSFQAIAEWATDAPADQRERPLQGPNAAR